MPITKPITGTVGWDDEVNATIDRANDLETLGYYPLSGYGMHSASCAPDTASGSSQLLSWMVRVWVASTLSISTVAVPVSTVGTVSTGGFNAFAIYSDDGTSLLGQTNDDDAFWTTVGWRTKALTSTIAASSTGRFVRVIINLQGWTTGPTVAGVLAGGGSEPGYTINGAHRRSAYILSPYTSFPASIDPSSVGSTTNYVPLLFLG